MKKVVIIFLAAVFMLAMYVPVSATDWNIYGNARVQTFFTDYDEDIDDPLADRTDFDHSLNVVSRLGAMVDHGIVGGHVEVGFAPGIYTRHMYGTVDMPFGQLLIGQTWAPYGAGSFISSQVYASDEGGLPFIGYGHRKPMIQLTVDNFKIALIETQRVGFGEDEFDKAIVGSDDSEVLLPQVQLSYDMAVTDGIALHFAGAFQTYELKGTHEIIDPDLEILAIIDPDLDPVIGEIDYDGETLNAFGITANARFTMMDPMYLNIGGFYGVNHAVIDATYNDVMPEIDGNDIADTDSFGILLAVGTKVNDIGLELGFGYRQDENDTWDDPLEMMLIYANANIPLTPEGSAFIVPEIGYYDYDMDDADLGDKFYAGLKWQVNF